MIGGTCDFSGVGMPTLQHWAFHSLNGVVLYFYWELHARTRCLYDLY